MNGEAPLFSLGASADGVSYALVLHSVSLDPNRKLSNANSRGLYFVTVGILLLRADISVQPQRCIRQTITLHFVDVDLNLCERAVTAHHHDLGRAIRERDVRPSLHNTDFKPASMHQSANLFPKAAPEAKGLASRRHRWR